MESSKFKFAKASAAGLLAVLLAVPPGQAAPLPEQQDQQQQPPVPALPQPSQQQPDATPQSTSQPSTPRPSAPDAPSPQPAEPATPPSDPPSDQSGTNKPVGTAVAPVAKTTGVAASRPAGAVIAPAKQRRVRAIVIRVGIIVGAGIAIGTVAALSKGSSSRP